MESWFKKNYKTIIVSAFLIPIITVALVSISHVTKWYGISNPFTWSIYLSIGIEIAALSALAAISADMGKKVYFPFGLVTLVQFIGNIYFAYSFIDITSPSFKSWVELVAPFVEFMGVDPTDYVGHKRFLAFFSGGMLPIISLSFLHMLVKFTQENKEKETNTVEENHNEIPVVEAKDIVGEVSRVRLTEEDLVILEKHLNNTSKSTEEPIREPETTPTIEQPPLDVYEKELDGYDGFDDFNGFIPEPFTIPEEVEGFNFDTEVNIIVTPTPTITPTPTDTPTMTPTDTATPTFTPTVTLTLEEVVEVLPEIIPISIPTQETPLPTIEDMPIEDEGNEEEFSYTPEEIKEIEEWDVTLMDGLEDEETYEEPQDDLLIDELPTIESEEEKKK